MDAKHLVTVYGGTGSQGSSVIQSLLANKEQIFKIRVITRDPSSAKAQALSSQGVEVVKANGFKKDEIVKAFEGSWAVFVNTNSDDPAFDDPTSPNELELGKIIVDAAVEAGVPHFVYSGGASASETSKGEVKGDAFDFKNGIENYARSKPDFNSVIAIRCGWYMENSHVKEISQVFGGFPHTEDEEGYLTFVSPKWGGKEDVPFVGIMDDYGDLVHGALLNPKEWKGRIIQAVSDPLNFDEFVAAFVKATGKKARFVPLPSWKDFQTYGARPLETLKAMFGFCQVSGGLYFGTPTETKTAETLKRAATLAKGKDENEATLMTVEKWFKREFGGN